MDNKQLKALHIERGGVKRMLTHYEKKVFETPNLDECSARALIDSIAKVSEKFMMVQTKIEILVQESAEQRVHEENEGDSFTSRCMELELKLKKIAETGGTLRQQDESIHAVLNKQTEIMNKLVEVQSSNDPKTRTKLPELTIPKFSGEYTDWPYFRDVFDSTIHKNTRLADIEKLRYLKTSLEGSAVDDVKNILLSNENYEPTWERLNKRYDKPVHLVNAYIQQFMAQSQKKINTTADLQEANRKYKQVIDGLSAMGPDCMTLDMWLIYLMKLNMHEKFRTKWEESRTADKLPKIDDFFDFMTEATDVMERANMGMSTTTAVAAQHSKSGFKTHHTNASTCPECDGEHVIYVCEKFKDLSLNEKRDRMMQYHLCYNCMMPRHSAARCTSKTSCLKCGKRHHTLLHSPKMDPTPEETTHPEAKAQIHSKPQTDSGPDTSTITTHHSSFQRKALLPTAVVYVKDVYGNKQACRVLIDGGGECTMVSEECAQRLALPRSKARIAVQGAGETTVGYTRGMIRMEIISKYDTEKRIRIEAYVMEKVTSLLPSLDISAKKWDHLNCLQLADPNYRVPGKIDIILGADYAMAINIPQILRGNAGEPIAQLTIFGWIVGGQIDSPLESITSLHTQCNLDDMLKKFWEVEQGYLDKRQLFTEEEVMCEENFTETHTRNDIGRYVVRLPFKKDHSPLGNSSKTALARFQSLERRFSRDSDLREQYAAFMGEYQNLGHMEPLIECVPDLDEMSYFMPHQPVLRPSSETTKLRVVFDASATTRPNNPSLNDILAVGPTRQDDLLALLLRFRTHPVALTADVEKMYRQIVVASEDQNYQLIYWRDNMQNPVQVFRLTTVTYGTSSAPFLAVRVLHQIAEDYKDQFPEACRVISTSFYMDDLLCGADSIEKAKKLQKDVQEVLGKAHFTLRKWTSNSCEVLDEISSELRAITPDEVRSDSKAISALGLKYLPGPD